LTRHGFDSVEPFASKFEPDVDIRELVRIAANVQPVAQEKFFGRFQRVVQGNQNIGTDRRTGQPTSAFTVIHDQFGNVITVFPGSP